MPENESTRRRSAAASPSRRGRFPSPAISLVVARVQLRRMVRGMRANDYFLLGVAIVGIPVVLGLLVAFDVARSASAELAGDSTALDAVPLLLAGGWALTVGFHLVTAVGDAGDVDEPAGVLTARPPKDVAGGLLGVWTAYYGAFVFVPVLVGFVGVAVGTGSVLPPIGGVAAATVTAVTAGAVGYPLGLAVKGALRRTAVLHRLKPAIGLAIGVAYFWVMFTGRWLDLLEAVEPVLLEPPVSWIGDLALATTPGAEASATGAVGALVVAAVVVPIGALATVRAAEYAWSADRALAGTGGDTGTDIDAATVGDATTAGDAVSSGDAATAGDAGTAAMAGDSWVAPLLDAVCRRPGTRGVAEVVLLRSYRRPMLLVFALWPLLLAIPTVDQLAVGGSLPWYAPWFAILVGAWIAGETVPLNVLGNQGATLPTLLTSRAGGRAVVHGHLVAVALPLAPLAAVLAVGAGVLAGRPALELPLLGVAAVAAVAASAVLAAGLGALFPNFDTVSVGSATEVTVPDRRAFGAFSLTTSLGTTGLVLAVDDTARLVGSVLLSEWLPFVSPTPDQLQWVGLVLAAALALAVPVAYVVAVRRIDGYRL